MIILLILIYDPSGLNAVLIVDVRVPWKDSRIVEEKPYPLDVSKEVEMTGCKWQLSITKKEGIYKKWKHLENVGHLFKKTDEKAMTNFVRVIAHKDTKQTPYVFMYWWSSFNIHFCSWKIS